MGRIQQKVEQLTGGEGGGSSTSSLPVQVEVATTIATAVANTIFTPVKDSVDTEDVPLAVLSKLAYDNYSTGDTQKTQQAIEDYKIGYDIIPNLTSPEYITAVNEADKKVAIAYRGTDAKLTNIYDDIADIEIGLGLAETPLLSYIPSRFRTGENIYKEVKNKYPDYEINLTGHSLGGTTARYVGDRYNEKAVVFSAGATPLEPFIEHELGTAPSKAKFYLTDTLDVISNTSRLTEHNVNIVKTKDEYRKYFTGSHSVENYLPELNVLNPISKPNNIANNTIPKAQNIPKVQKLNTINTPQVITQPITQPSNDIINKKMDIQKRMKETQFQEDPFQKSICEIKPWLCYNLNS